MHAAAATHPTALSDRPVLGSTVLMSCGWPLLNSVLNDYVPKSTRARWNSVSTCKITRSHSLLTARAHAGAVRGGRSLPMGRGALRWP